MSIESVKPLDPKKQRVISWFSDEGSRTEFSVSVYQTPTSSALAKEFMETFLKTVGVPQALDLYNEFQYLYAIWTANIGLRKAQTKHFTISRGVSKCPSCTIGFKSKTVFGALPSQQQYLSHRVWGRMEYEKGQWFIDRPAAHSSSNLTVSHGILDKLRTLVPELDS